MWSRFAISHAGMSRQPVEHRERALRVERGGLLRVVGPSDEIPLQLLLAAREVVTEIARELVERVLVADEEVRRECARRAGRRVLPRGHPAAVDDDGGERGGGACDRFARLRELRAAFRSHRSVCAGEIGPKLCVSLPMADPNTVLPERPPNPSCDE